MNENNNLLNLRAIILLATIFGLRMFGLFMLMPIFTIYAKNIPGGNNTFLVGLALGIYGLTQSIFYIPYGYISDKIGRKPVIVAGLVIFSLGSIISATSSSIIGVIIGRAIQGSGAISSVITAFVADLTNEHNRIKAMAIIGVSIGIAFCAAIVLSPILLQFIGMSGLFFIISLLALLAIYIILYMVPTVPLLLINTKRIPFSKILNNFALLRLNIGVFILHITQTSLFTILPHRLEKLGLPINLHWQPYLIIMVISFLLMILAIIIVEKFNCVDTMLKLAIVLILVSQLCFAQFSYNLFVTELILLLYFTGFNFLEALQPSLISKYSPIESKGTAMGIYNTIQALGLFVGSLLGGLLMHYGSTIFYCTTIITIIWLFIYITWKQKKLNTVVQ